MPGVCLTGKEKNLALGALSQNLIREGKSREFWHRDICYQQIGRPRPGSGQCFQW
jgi:hypothetical protein